MLINAKTRCMAIIGSPIEHSLTPVIQNAVFEEKGINHCSLAFEVKKEGLRDALSGLKVCGVPGVAVTLPHKREVLHYLDEIDEFARMIGAVNFVHFENGKAIGYNTDGYGVSMGFREEGISLKGKKIVILGAGGAGVSTAFQVCLEGARKVFILNRTKEKAVEVAQKIKEKIGSSTETYELNKTTVTDTVKEADILVNTTSVGMYPHENQTLVRAEQMRKGLVAYDVIYNPLKPLFLQEAEKVGAKIVNGVAMLVYSIQRNIHICTGLNASPELMKEVILKHLGGKTE